MQKTPKVNIKGFFHNNSGYSKVNRNLALALKKSGLAVGINPTQPLNFHQAISMQGFPKFHDRESITIDSIVPTMGLESNGLYRILYTTIESSSMPNKFEDFTFFYNEVWVTSEFCKEVLLSHGFKKPVLVVPDIVDTSLYKASGEKHQFKPPLNPFVFVSVFQWGYRKGYDTLLRSYLQEFGADEPVSLLLIVHHPISKNEEIAREVSAFIKQIKPVGAPHIARCSKDIAESELPSYYRACDAFVLFSRGEGFGLPYCFREGTLLQTVKGYVPIENIKVNDMVVSGFGRVKKVTETHKNHYFGPMASLKHMLSQEEISVTYNHAFLAVCPKRGKDKRFLKHNSNPENWAPVWTRCDKLTTDHYLVYPLRKSWEQKYHTYDLLNMFPNLCNDEIYVWSKYSNQNKISTAQNIADKSGVSLRQVYHYRQDGKLSKEASQKIQTVQENLPDEPILKVKRHIRLDEDFAKLLGYYAAEGSIFSNSSGTEFSFHSNETLYHRDVERLVNKVFGLNTSTFVRGNRARVLLSSSIVAKIFSNLVGRGSRNKKIPDDIFTSPEDVIKSFLNGFINGDGGSYDYGNEISITTVSSNLARQYQKLMLDFGEFCSLYKYRDEWTCKISGCTSVSKWIEKDKRKPKSKLTSKIYRNKDFLFLRITELNFSLTSEDVYNIDVMDDKSYIAGIVSAHNCEASLCGLPVIGTNCSGQTMFLKPDNSFLVDVDESCELPAGLMPNYYDGQMFPKLGSRVVADARTLLRQVYENQKASKQKNNALKRHILSNYSMEAVAQIAGKRLREIWSSL